MARLEGQVSEAFTSLFHKRNFIKIFEEYDARHFGNEILVYQSPEISLQFVRDRGQILLDVGPADASRWYMAPRLYEFLHLANDLYGPADEALLRKHAAVIDEGYEIIANLFRAEHRAQTEDDLRRYWKIKAEELFPSDEAGEYGPH